VKQVPQLSLTCHPTLVWTHSPEATMQLWELCIHNVFPRFDAVVQGDPLEVDIWYGKTRMAGLQSGEDCMMINSVVQAQYINVTDTQRAIQTRRHSNSCPNSTQCIGWQNAIPCVVSMQSTGRQYTSSWQWGYVFHNLITAVQRHVVCLSEIDESLSTDVEFCTNRIQPHFYHSPHVDG